MQYLELPLAVPSMQVNTTKSASSPYRILRAGPQGKHFTCRGVVKKKKGREADPEMVAAFCRHSIRTVGTSDVRRGRGLAQMTRLAHPTRHHPRASDWGGTGDLTSFALARAPLCFSRTSSPRLD